MFNSWKPSRWALRVAVPAFLVALALSAQSTSAKHESVRLVTFRVELRRVFPDNIDLPAGRYHLRVLNTVVVGTDLSFTLVREDGQKVIDNKVKKNHSGAAETIDLAPGVYTLSVAGKQEWRSRITVAAGQ